jgi:hypothetical protein
MFFPRWILRNVFPRKPTENTVLIQTIAYSDEWVIVIQDQMRNFSAISWRDQVTIRLDDDDFRFVLDQHTKLDLYNASSLKQQSACRHVAPLGHIIPIPNQSGSNSLTLRAERRSNKYQFYKYLVDLAGIRTHDLSHPRSTR